MKLSYQRTCLCRTLEDTGKSWPVGLFSGDLAVLLTLILAVNVKVRMRAPPELLRAACVCVKVADLCSVPLQGTKVELH